MHRIVRYAVLAALVAVAGCAAAPAEVPAPAPTGPDAFCAAVRANVDAVKPLNALNAKGPAPHPAGEVQAAVAPLRVSYRTVLDTAPAELRPDAERAFELAEMQLDIYERTSGDATAVSTDPTYAARAQESAPALQRVQDFTRANCG